MYPLAVYLEFVLDQNSSKLFCPDVTIHRPIQFYGAQRLGAGRRSGAGCVTKVILLEHENNA